MMNDSDLDFADRDLMIEIAVFLEKFVYDDELKATYAGYALCLLVKNKFRFNISDLGYFEEWSGFSGDRKYPVGGEREWDRELDNDTFWKNPGRIDLTLYVAKRLREDAWR